MEEGKLLPQKLQSLAGVSSGLQNTDKGKWH